MNLLNIFKKKKVKPSKVDISEAIAYLNSVAGTWPVKFESQSQEDDVLSYWGNIISKAQQSYEKEETEESICNLSDLFRIGHNMDVKNCAQNASNSIVRCLELFPDSYRGNLVASYFYLSIDRSFAPKGEECLKKLQEVSPIKPCMEAERGLVFAYLYQDKQDLAISQAKAFTKMFGDDSAVLSVIEGITNGTLTIHQQNG